MRPKLHLQLEKKGHFLRVPSTVWLNLHVVDPLGVTIVIMGRLERADVVRLAIVVPCDNLNHGEALLENLIPAVED